MEWEEVFRIKPWSPLKDSLPNAQHIESNLYRIDKDKYAYTSDSDQHFEKTKPGAPFVTLIYWAASETAIRHCVLKDLSVPVPPADVLIPQELSFGTDGTYGALRQTAEIEAVPIAERASYHGQTGEFLYKLLDATKFIYYFPSRHIKKREKPYVIEIRLRALHKWK